MQIEYQLAQDVPSIAYIDLSTGLNLADLPDWKKYGLAETGGEAEVRVWEVAVKTRFNLPAGELGDDQLWSPIRVVSARLTRPLTSRRG
jgi:hypothetical protein